MKRFLLIRLLALTGAAVWLCGVATAAEPLRVSAAASLIDALNEIDKSFTAKHQIAVELNTGASSALARQIEAGAPADVFVSADLAKMEGLDQKGLVRRETRRNLLSNALVVIAPLDSGLKISSPDDLAGDGVKRIATGDPRAVPVGVYARKTLEKAKLWEKVEPKIVATDNVRSALAAVESGNLDAGIVYRTDAAISKKVKIVYEFEAKDDLKIVYPAAVLQDAKQPEAAAKWLDFLNGSESRAIFEKHGFIVLSPEPKRDDGK